jgi:hypothetical protein
MGRKATAMKQFMKGESVQVQEDDCDCYAVDSEVKLCPLHQPSTSNEESLNEAKERMQKLLGWAEEAQRKHGNDEVLREMMTSLETKDEEL